MDTPNRPQVWACFGLALVSAAVLNGCSEEGTQQQDRATQARLVADRADFTPDEVARMLEPNVLGVTCLFDPFNPWIYSSDHTRIVGIKINALYLRGPNYTGVFGDGIIRPRLLVASRDEKGEMRYVPLKEWEFDVDKAMPFRAKRRMKAGWGYALFLNWGDVDLAGRSVRLTVSFERKDGVIISGSKKDFRVPRPDSEKRAAGAPAMRTDS